MKVTKKIKIYVDSAQESKLWHISNLLNNLYNCALEQRIEAYKKNKITLSVFEQKREIPNIREELQEYQLPFARLLHETLLYLDRSYRAFFSRVQNKVDGKKGFPRFRSFKKFFTMAFEKRNIVIENNIFYYKFGIKSKEKPLKLKMSEKPPIGYGMAYLSHNNNGFFLSFSYDKPEKKIIKNNDVIAIDLGIKRMATAASTIQKKFFSKSISKNQMYFSKISDIIRSIRDKKKKGSNRWKYYTDKLSRIYQLKKNKSEDFLHKLSHKLTNKFVERTIVCGDLKIKSMVQKNNKQLNRVVQNNSLIYNFIQKLKYKSILYGKELVLINEAYTSKTCSKCGNIKSMSLSQRRYKCSCCGFEEDRDLNSAINILNRFLAQPELLANKIAKNCAHAQD